MEFFQLLLQWGPDALALILFVIKAHDLIQAKKWTELYRLIIEQTRDQVSAMATNKEKLAQVIKVLKTLHPEFAKMNEDQLVTLIGSVYTVAVKPKEKLGLEQGPPLTNEEIRLLFPNRK